MAKNECSDLPPSDIPTKWYNILPDLPEPLPPYLTQDRKAVTRLPKNFTKTASDLEFSQQRWIKIPDAVLDEYINCGRPRPLIRAHRLERYLKTPARIYYKCEDLPPSGTFKINTALPQAYWAKKEGHQRTIYTGSSKTRTKFAHAFAAKTFRLTPTLFITREDHQKKGIQLFFLKSWFDADLIESPSYRTQVGRDFLKQNPKHPGSLAIIKQEIAEYTQQEMGSVAVLSSHLNHILLTQTITGLEVQKQLAIIDEKPDVFIASVGGGSSLHGLAAPFMRDYLRKKIETVKFLAVESETSAKLAAGNYEYVRMDGPMSGLSVKAYNYEWATPPPQIIGRGIQSKYTAPIVSLLRHAGLIDTQVYPKNERRIFETAKIFLQTEGRLLAPESAYTISAVINEANIAKKLEEKKVIVAVVSALSYLDFEEKTTYQKFS